MLDKKTIEDIRKGTSESEEITKKRIAALRLFSELELPSQKTESWRYTSAKDIEFDEFDKLTKENTKISVKGKGIIVCSIKEGLQKNKELIIKYLPETLFDNEDKFSAMHNAFWNSGLFIYVPKNTAAEIRVTVLSKKDIVLPHNIIIVEKDSALNYFEEHSSEKAGSCFRNEATYIFAKDNTKINFHNFQNWKNNVISISNWKVHLSKDTAIKWVFGQFGGKFSRVKIDSIFNGLGSGARTFGVFFADKEQHFDITTDAYHNVSNTNNDILVKGVLDGKASSVYRGKIKILKEAQQTNSYLSNHSLMLSNEAISNSIPSLEIDANDVKASHGATIGRPDEEDIFYLMARGLPRKEAEKLIIKGYFSPVLEQIKNSEFRAKFESAIKEKNV